MTPESSPAPGVPSSERPLSVTRRVADFGRQLPGAEAALEVYHTDRQHGGSVLAAGLAFRVFLMLLPFSLLAASALGFVAVGGQQPLQEAAGRVGSRARS
ncbi:MAG: hypothetical protein M3024_08710 [Candidatus Dormibacteraeota bacterium]|nr:hypothetical protein [Candidatus Dormibacteraeota bacterium]